MLTSSRQQEPRLLLVWAPGCLVSPQVASPRRLVDSSRPRPAFAGHRGNQGARVSSRSRKCCEDNRMWPGSAVRGRRIQGSFCTLWNELRNAACLPLVVWLASGGQQLHAPSPHSSEAGGGAFAGTAAHIQSVRRCDLLTSTQVPQEMDSMHPGASRCLAEALASTC